MINLEGIEKKTEAHDLKITTNKKIRGLVVSALEESFLMNHPVSYNLERVFTKKKHLQPSKVEI